MHDETPDPSAVEVAGGSTTPGFHHGALMNVLGLAGKAALPVLVVALTRMFGPVAMGLYFLVTTFGEMTASALTVGSLDAMVVFGSRHTGPARQRADGDDSLYAVIGNAFALNVGVSSLLTVVCLAGADLIARIVYPSSVELPTAIRWFSISLPLVAIASTATSAMKIRMRMEYDVGIMSFGRPFALILFAHAAWRVGGGVVALMIATALSHAAAALVSGFAFSTHFDARRAAVAAVRARFDRNLIEFSVAQSVSSTVKRYLPRVNVAALAALGHPAESLALYSTAALVATSVREIEVALGSALVPIVARYRGARDTRAVQMTLVRATRIALALTLPAVFVLVLLRADVFAFVHPSYRVDTTFFLPLLLPALVSASVGLPGYFLVATGHYRASAANAAAVLVANTLLSVVLAPAFGLLGAAIAAGVSAATITVIEGVELWVFEGVRPGLGGVAASFSSRRSSAGESVA